MEPSLANHQRDNIFFNRALVFDKLCVLMIDSGSVTNIASTFLVDQICLATHRHSKPYNLTWVDTRRVIRVEERVFVPISIGPYSDVVLCDVVPMQICHFLLGRPWQYDQRTFHDGHANTYSFRWNGEMVTLLPCLPLQIKESKFSLQLGEEEGCTQQV